MHAMSSTCSVLLLLLAVLVVIASCDARDVTPDELLRYIGSSFGRTPTHFADDGADYVPSLRFEGCRPGYVFTTRGGKVGYHKDRPHGGETLRNDRVRS